ncbi:MAG: hypothetical protein NC311_02385 [Muribaculaceae bacterium]|nr:hypothetical protein [Muribaculaceae bacterium]
MKIKIMCVIAICCAYCNVSIADTVPCTTDNCGGSAGYKIVGAVVWCAINSYNGNDNCYSNAKASVLYSRLCDNGAHRGVNQSGYTRCFITQCSDSTRVPSGDGQTCGCRAGYFLSGGSCVQCAAGTYKAGSNTSTSCSSCPTWTGVYTTSAKTTEVGGTSATGATAITGCYVASGTYYDASGIFKIADNCAYKSL